MDERRTLDVWAGRRRVALGFTGIFAALLFVASILPESLRQEWSIVSLAGFAVGMILSVYVLFKHYRAYIAFKMALGYSMEKAEQSFSENYNPPNVG